VTGSEIFSAVLFIGIGLLAALVALKLSARYLAAIILSLRPLRPLRRPPGPKPVRLASAAPDRRRRYEFREGYLLSPIDFNDAFLDPGTDRSHAFDVLRRCLEGMHHDIGARLNALKARGEPFLLTAQFGTDPLAIAGRAKGDRLLITIGPAEDGEGREMVDSGAFAALKSERANLRDAIDIAPIVMWRVSPEDGITWANEPYFSLMDRSQARQTSRSWPVPALFDIDSAALTETRLQRRCQITVEDADDTVSFDVSAQRQADGTILCFAVPADRLVAAEQALQSFVRTLSQTFAHLPIGLVVFDRNRELVLFNPALTELTCLDPQFLSNRPTLTAFLDALRDRQRIPEPKDYKSWRNEIQRLEQGARDGRYQEIW